MIFKKLSHEGKNYYIFTQNNCYLFKNSAYTLRGRSYTRFSRDSVWAILKKVLEKY